MTDNPKKRVAFALPSFAGGGAEHVMITVINNLDTDLFEPHLIVFSNDGPLRDSVAPHVQLHSLNVKRVGRGAWRYLTALWRIKPHAVLTTMAHLNFLALILRFFAPRTRVIVREAITPDYFFTSFPRRVAVKMLYRCLYPQADFIIAPTKLALQQLKGLLGKRMPPHQRILNPAIPGTAARARPDFFLPHKTNFIATGRLHPQKGFDRLIEALATWRARDDWHFMIFGEGPERANLQALINHHGLADHIKLLGFVPNFRAFCGHADCFLLPSRHEGLPNVALEALANGTPVIAHQEAGGIVDIAEYVQPPHLMIAGTMPEFLHFMDHLSHKTPVGAASFLPEDFNLANITKAYQKVLSD